VNQHMGTHHPNPRLVKIHRTYSVEELAPLFKVHPNTIRAWRDSGLTPIDEAKPMLFLGSVIVSFLERRRAAGRRPSAPGQIFCLPCRELKQPAFGIADFVPLTETNGDLQGLCPDCERLMHRRVNRTNLQVIAGDLEVEVRMRNDE
jgi:hypothetical protein